MKTNCEFCGALIDSFDAVCAECGGKNPNARVTLTPDTIEELIAWYKNQKLPPEDITRFFIGKDYKGPKAYGIYKNAAGNFVVYKNKPDGSRSIRYEGGDEAYAVNELFMKLKDVIAAQKGKR